MNDSNSNQSIDVTAPSIEEAIARGLEQLGLARNEVIIEVLEEGAQGLYESREAVIRLTPLRLSRSLPPTGGSILTGDEVDDVRIGREVLGDLLELLQINARIQSYKSPPLEDDEEPPWVLDIKGEDLGVLIGWRGDTLGALQYITRLIVSRDLERYANIVLDVEGYKARRESALRKLAERMAAQACKLGRTVSLEPMPANERRIIHMTLRADKTVRTESVGEGERRKVTIIPVKK